MKKQSVMKSTGKLLSQYLSLKSDIREKEFKLDSIGQALLDVMEEIGVDTFEDDAGSVTQVTKVMTKYSDNVREKIQGIRADAEKSGEITFSTATYLRATLK